MGPRAPSSSHQPTASCQLQPLRQVDELKLGAYPAPPPRKQERRVDAPAPASSSKLLRAQRSRCAPHSEHKTPKRAQPPSVRKASKPPSRSPSLGRQNAGFASGTYPALQGILCHQLQPYKPPKATAANETHRWTRVRTSLSALRFSARLAASALYKLIISSSSSKTE